MPGMAPFRDWRNAGLCVPVTVPLRRVTRPSPVSVDLIIRSQGSEVAIAVLRDKLLMELHRERTERGFAVGDIYLAKVRKVAPGLNAAFVEVGHEEDAFLD